MKKVLKRVFRYIIFLLFIGVIALGLLYGGVYIGVFGKLPTEQELASIQNEEASLVYSYDGEILGKYFAENRTNIGWSDVPRHLVNALVATEDKRFFEHKGYDSRSYVRVFFKSILLGNRSSGGGSTITQQLVKNLYGRNYHNFLSMPINKIKEAILAVRMEKALTKEQVLLLYLNSVPFGEDVYGIEAASIRFFNKHCKQLSIDESAVLVGALKANTYYNPRMNPDNAIARRNQVLQLMKDQDYISEEKFNELSKKSLNINYLNYNIDPPAGYFVFQVKQRVNNILNQLNLSESVNYDLEKDGLKIYTTIDSKLQQSARNSIRKQLSKMQKFLDKQYNASRLKNTFYTENADKSEAKNRDVFSWDKETAQFTKADSLWHYYTMLNAAVLAVDPHDGSIRTWVGGNNFRYLPFDLVLAKRQIASAIKPLIYSSALEKKLVPCDYLSNELVVYKEYDGWTPRNYDNSSSSDTLVALWYALANSMNLPTMDLYFKTGYDDVSDMLYRFGLNPPVYETPSIAIGTMDVSLMEIVRAYTTFANMGTMVEDLVMIDKITDSKGNIIYERPAQSKIRVMEKGIADQVNYILQRAVNEGTGKSLRSTYGLDSQLAGKTGTAQNYSNAWFISYTPDIVIGTWVGAMTPEVHFNGGLGSGSVLSLPVAANVLADIENNSNLRKEYLADFTHIYTEEELLHCDPFFEKGLKGFIHSLSDDKENDTIVSDKPKESKPEKKKTRIGRFFQKIFGGGKK